MENALHSNKISNHTQTHKRKLFFERKKNSALNVNPFAAALSSRGNNLKKKVILPTQEKC